MGMYSLSWLLSLKIQWDYTYINPSHMLHQ